MITNIIIKSFLQCKHKGYLLLHNISGIKTDYELVQNEITESYKEKYFNYLKTDSQMQLLPTFDFGKKNSFNKNSYVIIPSIKSSKYKIMFDVVEITIKPSTKEVFITPTMISPNGKVSQLEKFSLAISCIILSNAYNITVKFGKIVYESELKSLKFHVSTYRNKAEKIIREMGKVLHNQNHPRFFNNKHCSTCTFNDKCKAELTAKDDLSLLGKINEKEVLKRNNRGIFTINQLSYTFNNRRKRKNSPLNKTRYLWELKALSLRENKTYIKDIPKLSTSKIEIYLDFEGLPDENFCYLIGVIICNGTKEDKVSLWANSIADEEAIFKKFFYLLSKFKSFTIYHYGSYEIQVIKKFNNKHDNAYDIEVSRIIQYSVNVLSFISSTVYLPTYTNGLKEVAKFLGFTWSDKTASGIQSIVWRKRWEITSDDIYKVKLEQYNIEDCVALQLTKEWLQRIEKIIEQKGSDDILKTDEVKTYNKYQQPYCNFESLLEDFEKVNKYAYFDYQREKIFLKNNAKGRASS